MNRLCRRDGVTIVKYQYFAASLRGFFKHAVHTPRVSGLIAGALIILGSAGAIGLNLSSSQPANAGGTCRPNTAYAIPATLPLESATTGLTVSDDGISVYGVGGDSIGHIRDALNSCAPRFNGMSKSDEFLAYTSYAVNWDYSITDRGDGVCTLTNVKVGLHLSQIMPALVTTSNAGVSAKWGAFHTGLQTHEDGHKTVDITQARALLTSLTTLSAPCADISVEASHVTITALQGFVTANQQHDTLTHHGKDQGAVW